MGTIYKIFFITLLVGSLVYARSGKDNPRVEEKKVKSEHYWVKGDSKDDGDKSLKRKRTHKRRRKIRKPIKGLR